MAISDLASNAHICAEFYWLSESHQSELTFMGRGCRPHPPPPAPLNSQWKESQSICSNTEISEPL